MGRDGAGRGPRPAEAPKFDPIVDDEEDDDDVEEGVDDEEEEDEILEVDDLDVPETPDFSDIHGIAGGRSVGHYEELQSAVRSE